MSEINVMLQVFTKTNHRSMVVETRRGDPMDVADLLRTRCSAARNVFIMHPDANTTVCPMAFIGCMDSDGLEKKIQAVAFLWPWRFGSCVRKIT